MSNQSKIKIGLEMEDQGFSKSLENAQGKIKALSQAIKQVAQVQEKAAQETKESVSKVVDALEKETKQTTRVRDARGRYVSSASSATDANQKLANSFNHVGASAGTASTGLNGVFKMATQLGGAIGALAFIKSSISSAASFSKELANVQSIANDLNMAVLKKEIESVDSALGSSAEITHALYFAYSAGIRGTEKEMVEFTSQMARLNAAVAGDMTATMDAATTLMNAYSLSVNDAGKVSDWFYQVVKSGKTEGPALANSLGMVAATAAAAKVPLDDLGASIALLTTTMPTAQAITALNQSINGFISPSEEAKKTAKELGIELSVSAIQSKGFVGMMEEVKEKTGGSAEAIAKLFSSVDAQKAVLALTGAQFDSLKKSMIDFQNNAGAANEASKDQLNSFDAHLNKIKVNIEKQMIALGEQFKGVAQWIADIDYDLQNVIITGIATASAIVGITLAVKGLTVAYAALQVAWNTNPIGLMLTGAAVVITGAAMAISAMVETIEEKYEKAQKITEKAKEATQEQLKNNQSDLKKLELLQRISEKTIKNKEDFEDAEKLVSALTSKYGDLGITFDKLNGQMGGVATAVSKLRDEIQKETVQKLKTEIETKKAERTAAFEKIKNNLDIRDFSNQDVKDEWAKLGVKNQGLTYNIYDRKTVRENLALKHKDELKPYDNEIMKLEERLRAAESGDDGALLQNYKTADEKAKARLDAEEAVRKKFDDDRLEGMKKISSFEKSIMEKQMSDTDKKIAKIEEETQAYVDALNAQKTLFQNSIEPQKYKGEVEKIDLKIKSAYSYKDNQIQKVVDDANKSENEKKQREEEAIRRKQQVESDKKARQQEAEELKLKNQKDKFLKQKKELSSLISYDEDNYLKNTQSKNEKKQLDESLKTMSVPEGIQKVNSMINTAAIAAMQAKETYNQLLSLYAQDGNFTDDEKDLLGKARKDYQEKLAKRTSLEDRLSGLIDNAQNMKVDAQVSAGFSASNVGRSLDITTPILETAMYIKQQVELQKKNNDLIKSLGVTF